MGKKLGTALVPVIGQGRVELMTNNFGKSGMDIGR